jgi:MFS family permease
VFSTAFGAMLLSCVLWAQDVWHWSALSTGLAIAPGPLMVPLFGFAVAGRLSARFGPGAVIAAGSTIFAAGAAWWALALGLEPDYVGDMLGGMILTGIGVGLTLPTLMATGASSLPAHSFATGSAVLNMLRQIGLAVGVAILIAILGTSGSLGAYEAASWVIAAISFAGGLLGLAVLSAPRRREGPGRDQAAVGLGARLHAGGVLERMDRVGDRPAVDDRDPGKRVTLAGLRRDVELDAHDRPA